MSDLDPGSVSTIGERLRTAREAKKMSLADVASKHNALTYNDEQYHEDLPHFYGDEDHCSTCRGIAEQALWESLDALKAFLGSTVCSDLRQLAAA